MDIQVPLEVVTCLPMWETLPRRWDRHGVIERKCLYVYKCNKFCEEKVLQEEENDKSYSKVRKTIWGSNIWVRSESTRSRRVGIAVLSEGHTCSDFLWWERVWLIWRAEKSQYGWTVKMERIYDQKEGGKKEAEGL